MKSAISTTNASVRNCPVCGMNNSQNAVSSYSRDEWEIKQCDCGCVYLENPPSYEALEETYSWEKTSSIEEIRRKKKRPLAKAISQLWKLFRQKVLKRDKLMLLARKYIAEGNVLDIGCGSGGTLARLPLAGHVPYGVEISVALAKESDQLARKRGGYVVQANAIEGVRLFDENFFSGILMSAFLEHEVQPAMLLNELQRVLAPGGVVIIKVPNFASWNRRMKGAEWCGFRFPDHVNYFTPHSLQTLVEQSGFKSLQFGLFDHFPTSDNMWMVLTKE